MVEEHHEHHDEHKHEVKPQEHKAEEKKRFKINYKLTRGDLIGIIALIVFLFLVAIPIYGSKNGCEVARPAYKCESAKDVLIENCNLWSNYSCDSSGDVSLPQVEWYIGNLCNIQNKLHNSGLDCTNLKQVCNTILERQVCQ